MIKCLSIAAFAALLLTAQLSFADDSAEPGAACYTQCDKAYAKCMADINFPNDIEVQDAQEACRNVSSACNEDCTAEVERTQQQQEEKALQEQN